MTLNKCQDAWNLTRGTFADWLCSDVTLRSMRWESNSLEAGMGKTEAYQHNRANWYEPVCFCSCTRKRCTNRV